MAKTRTMQRRKRTKPGARGGGRFFHIQVRPRSEFVTFRNQNVGGASGVELERVAGRRADGSWDTQKWLIGKDEAHLAGHKLVADSLAAERVLKQLGSTPRHVGGDRFVAKPRRKIPASAKPTPAMRRAQLANIKKAQAAVRKRRGSKTRSKAS